MLLWFLAAWITGQVLAGNQTFTVDYMSGTFLKDGQPFRYISGSIHYARIHPYYWRDRLMKMKVVGLNAISTYVPWNIHEPQPGQYKWTGFTGLESFLQMSQEVGLYVLLRVGPYISAEWEFGGFPAWLLTKNKNMKLRTMDPSFTKEVEKWFDVLLGKIKPYLYENGGPVIMIQIENEYGSYLACDYYYMILLYQKVRSILGSSVVVYTTDGAGDVYLNCGSVKGAYATVNFGVTDNPNKHFAVQRHIEPTGPLVNNGFNTGWLDHWGAIHSVIHAKSIATSLDLMLAYGANVNMYMFEGGTNFGYWNGAHSPPYEAVPTSYDYDAPLSEAGDVTAKYIAIGQIISKYNQLPSDPIPSDPLSSNTPKYPYGNTTMKFISTIQGVLDILNPGGPIKSKYPLTMEEVKFYYGFILYRHVLTANLTSPTQLCTNGTRDRGYVMVHEVPMGIFNRDVVWQMNITGNAGQYLDILVENQGRINYGPAIVLNRKGLIYNVTLGGIILTNWEIHPLRLENVNTSSIQQLKFRTSRTKLSASGDLMTPSVYMGKIPVPEITGMPQDTFLDMRPWHKGQALVNGFNLGRYWPDLGPQVTLYVPKPVLVAPPADNMLVMLELEHTECMPDAECNVKFTDRPLLNMNNYLDDFSVHSAGSVSRISVQYCFIIISVKRCI